MTLQRLYPALVMLSLFFLWVFIKPLSWLLAVLVVVFGLVCLSELGRLIRTRSLRFPYPFVAAFALLLLYDGWRWQLAHGLYILIVSIVLLLTYRVLASDFRNIAAETGAALLALAYIGLPMGMAVALGESTGRGGEALGKWNLIFQASVVFGGDIAAYFVGRNWGKRRFFPKLSPNKTLEGAGASVAVSIAFALLLVLAVPTLRRFYGLGHGLILGALLGVAAPLGDLAESAFKRDAGEKDSGHVLSGHGGFLDVFDAILFGLPIQFCYVQLVLAAS